MKQKLNKLRFIHVSDLHAGISTYSKYVNGENNRLTDWQNAFEYMIEYIKTNSIQHCIIGGDLFHSNNPTIETLVVVNQCLAKLSKVVQNVFLVAGNHDITSLTIKKHILQSITLDNVYILDKTGAIELNEFNIYHYHYLNNQYPTYQIDDSKYRIVTFHGNIIGAEDDLGHTIKDSQIPKQYLFDSNPHYVALGHIHKFQILDEKIIYPGSFIQTSFSERGKDKGFLDVELDNDNISIKQIITPHIKYFCIEDVINLTKEKIKNKIVRIDTQIDRLLYKDILEEAAFVIYNPIKTSIKHKNGADLNFDSLDIELDLNKLIDKYLNADDKLILKELLQGQKEFS